jgi:ornithine decarboxylase
MHPVKSREAIFDAYFNHGIRDFSLDSFDELQKILEVTKNAQDLGLHMRLAIPNSHAAIDLSGKFGILPSESIGLLRKIRAHAQRLGICFHVGSQCMEPSEYRNAITIAKEVIEQAKVKLDVIDIGGGFPSSYPGMTPPNLQAYFDEIFDSIQALKLDKNCRIWCEPGRALVAEAGSLLVRVEARKKGMLYLNDGTYGGLFDAGFPGFIYPVKALRIKEGKEKLCPNNAVPFGFYGPTCDSLDSMKGPFYLPENIAEGDYIEIGQLGAYSRSIRTEFNGFNKNLQIEVADEPLVSMYKNLVEKQKTERSSA